MSKENLSKGTASHRIHHIYPRDFVVDRKRHPKYHDFYCMENLSKRDVKTTTVYFLSKPH